MVPQVGGDVDVGDIGGVLEERVAGTAAHRHGANEGVWVTGDPDALAGARKSEGDRPGEVGEGRRLLESADAARAHGRVAGLRHEWPSLPDAQGVGQGVGHPRVGVVGVGVCTVQGDAVRDQRVGDPSPVADRGHRVHAAQEQGVVGHEEVRLQHQGLVDDGHHRIDGEEHATDRGIGITARQADGVPCGRQRRRVAIVEKSDDLAHGHGPGHAGQATHSGIVARPVGSLRVGP